MIRQQSFTNDKATLFIVATPIGNLKEISTRCIETLNSCSAIFCEDTRVSGNLLSCLNIHKPLISAYENIEKTSSIKALQYLSSNENIALISDAGYPCISDPGSIIVQEAIKNNYNVVVINGPSALIHSIVASGFNTSNFYFFGFLSAKQTERIKQLNKIKNIYCPIIFYQSPHKIKNCLQDMLNIFGNKQICICRELTKKYEEFLRGTILELIDVCESLKGEMVIVLDNVEEIKHCIPTNEMIYEINIKIQEGLTKKEAIKDIANKYNISKNELYNFYHKGE